MINNTLIVIRSCGERTRWLCRQLVADEVPEENIVTIQETPFSRAIMYTYSTGIENGLRWTLAIDADVLIKEGSIGRLIELGENADDNVFELQGVILDKLFQTARPGGQHLYRTSLLAVALDCIPVDGVSLRPETYTIKQMAAKGYPWIQTDLIMGMHGYHQYYRDVYRCGFQHGVKHRCHIPRLRPLWKKLAKKNPDYAVALLGLEKGENHKGSFHFDAQEFNDKFRFSPVRLNLTEKESMDD